MNQKFLNALYILLIFIGCSSSVRYLLQLDQPWTPKLLVASPLPLVFDAPSGFEWWAVTESVFEIELEDGRTIKKEGREIFDELPFPHRLRAKIFGASMTSAQWQKLFCEENYLQYLGSEGKVSKGTILYLTPSSPNPEKRRHYSVFQC